LIANPTNQTIYYNYNGSKYFDYEDAIKIGQITAKDSTTYASYYMNYTYSDGSYTDPSSSLFSDRNTSQTSYTISSKNLHDYVLSNDILSFSGGMLKPTESYDISNNKFTIDQEYTIGYTNDKPTSIAPGSIAIANGRTFTIGGKNYIISGNRVITYNTTGSGLTKVPVANTTYSVTTDDIYLMVDTGDTVSSGSSVEFVKSLDNPSYSNKYVGFITIEFIYVTSSSTICTIGETVSTNNDCFKEMNKRIDTVRNFKMKFTTYDYVGHTSASIEVTVEIIDDTAPGFTSEFVAQGDGNTWTNKFANSACMLEIGNLIQPKTTLVNCYLIGAGVGTGSETYHFKDNDTLDIVPPNLPFVKDYFDYRQIFENPLHKRQKGNIIIYGKYKDPCLYIQRKEDL